MTTLMLKDRLDRLDTFISEGRLVRQKWRDTTEDGRERACLLAALSPETGERQDASACPISVMPQWLALLTPWIDDAGSAAEWPSVVRRYASVARRWHVLTSKEWHRLDFVVRALAVREAMAHVDAVQDPAVAAVCAQVAALCDREADGSVVPLEEWGNAAYAAYAANAAFYAANAAASAAYAANPGANASAYAAYAAAYAAVDRQIDKILTALEEACTIAEARK